MRHSFQVSGKVVFIRVNRLDYVPSGLYAAELLAEAGFPVLAIEYGFFHKGLDTEDAAIPRLRLGHPWARKLPAVFRSPVLHLSALYRLCRLFAEQGRPQLIVSQGLHEQALVWALSLVFGVPYICHVHEVFEFSHARGWNKFFLGLERFALRRSRLNIFPESERARIYQSRYQLQSPLYIASNCPRKRTPSARIDWRHRLGLPADARLVGYWGGQGKMNALEQGIRAIARMPKTYFLLWGWSSKEDRAYFQNLATGVGATHRVFFMGELPEDKWATIAGLDVGYCMYEPVELRFKHLATASNKLMESIAVGVPVITSNGADFRAIVEEKDVGECAAGFSVEAIASALKHLFADEMGRQRKSENALRLHREVFNYETQFEPILRATRNLLALNPAEGSLSSTELQTAAKL